MKTKLFIFLFLIIANGYFAQSFSVGFGHSLSICSDSTILAWGHNGNGEIGNGTTTISSCFCLVNPAQVQGLTSIIAVQAYARTSLALKADGTVWAWGYNHNGELGVGDTIDRNIPTQIIGLTGIVKISHGYIYSLAIKNDGTVWTWGDNSYGQLGDSTHIKRTFPVQAIGLTGIVDISGAWGFTTALKNDGTLWKTNTNGYFTQIFPTFTGVISIISCHNSTTSSSGYCLALKSDSTVWGWGTVQDGQLCNFYYNHGFTTPVQILDQNNIPLTGIKAIAASIYNGYAVKNDGTVWAWGRNTYGGLGNGSNSSPAHPVPNQVGVLTGITDISSTAFSALAKKNDGTLWGWGTNEYGQLGNGIAISGGCICTATPVQAINLCTLPACAGAGFSYGSTAYCKSTTAPALPVLHMGVLAGTFTASAGLALTTNTGAVNLPASAAGTYTVTNTVPANAFCAAASYDSIITVLPLPAITASASTHTLCEGSMLTLTGVGGVSYTWDNGINDGVPFAPATGTATYAVTGTDTLGCVNTNTTSATVLPVYTIDSYPAICNGHSYSWLGGTYTTQGTYTHLIPNGNGCNDVYHLHLTVKPTDTTAISGTDCNSYTYNTQTYTATGMYMQTFTNINGCDSVLKLNVTINNNGSTSVVSACNNYILNSQTYTSSGTYMQTLTNTNSCDSVLTLNLTIDSSNTVVNINGNALTAAATGTYQWLNCTTGYSPITGQTSQTYTATATGDYAVRITNGSCVDTSACVYVMVTGIGLQMEDDGLLIYPNPVTTTFIVESTNNKLQSIKIMDIIGKEILQTTTGNPVRSSSDKQQTTIDMSGFAKGIYFVRIEDENKIVVNRKIIKQ